MPKNLFYKLSKEKKNKLIQSAKEVFIKNNYDDVSINEIVKKAKISRGGFYLYFNDKRDLYFYLIDEASLNLIDKLKVFQDKSKDVFDFCEKAYDYHTSRSGDFLFMKSAIGHLNERVKEYIVKKGTINDLIKLGNKDSMSDEMNDAFRQLIISTYLTSLARAFKNNDIKGEKEVLMNKLEIIKKGYENM